MYLIKFILKYYIYFFKLLKTDFFKINCVLFFLIVINLNKCNIIILKIIIRNKIKFSNRYLVPIFIINLAYISIKIHSMATKNSFIEKLMKINLLKYYILLGDYLMMKGLIIAKTNNPMYLKIYNSCLVNHINEKMNNFDPPKNKNQYFKYLILKDVFWYKHIYSLFGLLHFNSNTNVLKFTKIGISKGFLKALKDEKKKINKFFKNTNFNFNIFSTYYLLYAIHYSDNLENEFISNLLHVKKIEKIERKKLYNILEKYAIFDKIDNMIFKFNNHIKKEPLTTNLTNV